ncbi:rhamnogalacturonan lyase [uncultured Cellulomonas sp.]|uniref:rhamnogalacturonan lyase n=1 Tax=uncultured Cellulomonas sp. TaxID=189682 RepID=UPI0028E856B7|nr:rhamnogalacturonan lyase [uncultured Cellulomonas sp.]
MSLISHRARALTAIAGSALLVGTLTAVPASATPPAHSGQGPDALTLERLDRGLVAAVTGDGVFLSWRLLASEVAGATATGLVGPDFAVYRDGVKVGTVTDSTNFVDAAGTATSRYRVAAVVDGVEVDGAEATPWAQASLDIPLRKPADGVTPVGVSYTYSANDMSVGDVDGDGQYEYLVKWDPSNSKDVSQVGYTGNVFVDAYEQDGTLLWRIDLGVNIRAGAHYTQFPVYDFDGDGKAELMMKTAPGSTTTRYAADGSVASQKYVSIPKRDRDAGVTDTTDYRLSAAGYFDHLVTLLQGWSSHPEVVAGRWPSTVEAALGMAPQYAYPLSREDATALATYFVDTYAPARSPRNALRTFEGFIVDGPEYLTVFAGDTGKELQTIDYKPGRGDDGLLWGDYAMSRIEPGNRVDRFLAGVAYLDGATPSAVFARGYYTRTTLVAYDWDGRRLSERWYVDSGHVPMTNPFNDGPHGRDGTDPVYGKLTTQGFHSLSAADVDGDGKQEIVYGAATIDDDGSVLYSSFDTLPAGSAAPGEVVRLGHGDAMHVTDIDPDRPGLEIYTAHEGATFAPYGMAMRDAATGEVLFGAYSGRDTGRSMVGDVLPAVRGLEAWASLPGGSASLGLYSAQGVVTPGPIPGTNQSIRWLPDGTTQIINGSADQDVTIDDWTRGTQLIATGTRSNNGTKGNAALVADVLGDSREELLVRTADSSAIRLFTSTGLSHTKMYTLMHDPQYRVEVARQQTTYNQPSYVGFYLASDTDYTQVPVPSFYAPGSIDALRDATKAQIAAGAVKGVAVVGLLAAVEVADKAVDHGNEKLAARSLENYVDLLTPRTRLSTVTPAARATLGYRAQQVISMLD